uniref:Rootletin isoform X1 n=2 Tax=Diabrotica virgifera virgifera TaxID=50390 RepID=A0A6P7GY35_DIAVI
MPRPTVKKPETPKMEGRRPPSLYRPKSRTDSSSGTGGRTDSGRLRGDGGGGSSDEDVMSKELRHRLQEEASLYRKRLDTYKQAQQNQAALVSRLQAKVLQYKKRCADLESQMDQNPIYPEQPSSLTPIYPISTHTPSSAVEQAQQHLREIREERISDLDTALQRLSEERRRADRLMQLNTSLREQLEESHSTNEALTADLQKLTNDWENLREEMLVKEDEWKDEEQAFNDYYSTEHNRLLNLWRDVVGIKRLYNEIHTNTERDLSKIRFDISGMGKEMVMACSRMDTNLFTENIFGGKEKHQLEQEVAEMQSQIDSLKLNLDTRSNEIVMKDEKIQLMERDLHSLKERCTEAEHSCGQVVKMQEEIDILQGALRDIAHALIQDAENKDIEMLQATHLHLSAGTPLPQKSPKRSARSMTSPAAFAESTISAVQAALHKYQSFIHELQVKLQSNKEQLLLVRKQYENSENSVAALEDRLKEVVAQLDASHAQCSQVVQDRDLLHKNLEAVKAEKNQLDRNRIELNGLVESLQQDYDRLQKANNKMQKEVDSLQEEKMFMQTEIDRMNQEADIREINLRGEEDRCSRMREELLTVREELHKLYLAHDMLEAQKLEADNLIASLEKTKADYEIQLDRALGERTDVHDSLVKKETIATNLELDKKKLLEDIRKLDDEKKLLQHQCNDHQSDIQSLRKELLQAEQQKLDIESDKVSLSEKCKFLEIDKEKIEMELNQVTRERNELSNQLSVLGRKRDGLNEELVRCRQRLEQANETNARVNRTLEDLVKECEEKQCTIDAMDKEMNRTLELLATTRTEKETLEAVLFDAQTNLEASEDKKAQLEKEQQELLIKQEKLKAQIAKVAKDLERSEKKFVEVKTSMTHAAGNKEVEFKQTVDKIKQQNEDMVKKLTEEKEKIRTSLEKRLQQSLHKLTNEKDAEIQQLMERMENLQSHIENLCQQHEELMLRAENDKQQALLIAHHDHQALHDRLEATRRELEDERDGAERLKREANSRFEQDRTNINKLKEELSKYKTRLEEAKVRTEEEINKLEQRIEEVKTERDNCQSEAENLKIQLQLCENKSEGVGNQLHETLRKLKEATNNQEKLSRTENNSESLRKELTDVRRLLADGNFEKEKYHNTNKELRDHIKKTESEKREQARQLEDAYKAISNLEDIKVSLENERNRLQNQIRNLETEQLQIEHKVQGLQEELQRTQAANSQQQTEEKELQARLLNEVEERERAHQEVHQCRKQISELERNLDHTRLDLNKTRSHYGQLEEQWHAREQDLLVHLEDSKSKEKRLEDQKHNLEVCLVDATQQIQELKAKLGGAEGRVRALENQLVHLDSAKREVDQKLSSIISTLRRIAGIQLDGSVTMPYRLLSPSRRWSPARSYDDGRDGTTDVDPEVVRKGVRSLMQQVAQIERERDDYKTQVQITKKQLQEAQEGMSKGDNKLTKVLQNVRSLQEEKSGLEAKLGQKNTELQAQNNALQKKSEEAKEMRERVVSLELSLSSGNEQRLQYEDKMDKMKGAIDRLEAEKRSLQEELNRTENRSTKLELQRMSAEGDLQRLQMMLQEKDANIQKLQEKCDRQSRTIASLEERCVSLKSTIDQMTLSLEKASVGESELKGEMQSLQRALMDSTSASHTGAERLKQLQKQLANSENERRVITERFESTQQNLAEMRRNNQILQDQVARLNNELANNEVQRSGLESQLRLAQWPSDTGVCSHHEEELKNQLHSVQRERNDLRTKIESLNNKVRQLETENRSLERQASKGTNIRSKSYERERPEKYESESLSGENRDLRLKISQLETELSEKEAEIGRLRNQRQTLDSKFDRAEIERYRAAQLQAERLLEAREQSHRQQVARLENQITLLREQLNQEIKRRQQYVMRSSKAGREMQQLRQALGDSLRTVSQDPSLDALLLEHEARKLDNTLSNTASLPPALGLPSSSYRRATTPQPK